MKRSEKHICALVNNNYGTIRIDKIIQWGSGNLERSSAEMAESDQTGTSQEAQPGKASSASVRPWWRRWRSPSPRAIMIACPIGVAVMFALVLWASWICDGHGPFYVEVGPRGYWSVSDFLLSWNGSGHASNTVSLLYIWLCLLLCLALGASLTTAPTFRRTKDEVDPPCSQRGSRRVPESSDGAGITMVEFDESLYREPSPLLAVQWSSSRSRFGPRFPPQSHMAKTARP